MLKKRIIKKISIIICTIICVILLNIFPNKNEKDFKIVNKSTNGILYTLDENNYVSRLDILYNSDNTNDLVKEMIYLLTEDLNYNKLRQGFISPIPFNTKLIDYEIKDDTISLNFSKEFLNVNKDISEQMIGSIIYTITTIENINNVIIKINNEIIKQIPNTNISLPNILNRNYKLNKKYNVNSIENIINITTYHVAKKDDYTYFIPVTNYLNNNNNKEKIEIIIEELKSNNTLNNNIVNYINNNTKLINFEILDNSLILNLSESIFNNINSNTIKEEVTYAINLSIKENYQDISSSIIYINNNFFNSYHLFLG